MENTKKIEGEDKIYLGTLKETGERVYITKPTWDCDWYWSFGHLGNNRQHYHLNSYANDRNINMFDALTEDYTLTPTIKENLWAFCEQVLTIYALKNTYAVLYRGGSYMMTHPLKDTVQDTKYAEKLASDTLPKLLQHFWNSISE